MGNRTSKSRRSATAGSPEVGNNNPQEGSGTIPDSKEKLTSPKSRVPRFRPTIWVQSFNDIPSEYTKDLVGHSTINIEDIKDKNLEYLIRVLGFTYSPQSFKVGPPRTPEQLEKEEQEFRERVKRGEMKVKEVKNGEKSVRTASGEEIIVGEETPISPLPPLKETEKRLKEAEATLVIDANIKKTIKSQRFAASGGFGRVFKANMPQMPKDKRNVAIKKMKHVSEKEKMRNLNEIAFLQNNQHPNIVIYYRSYLEQDEVWMVMELMEGGTLGQAAEIFDFTDMHIAYVAREILKALAFMHEKGFAHRDIKSSNIMLTIHGDVKIIDFGFVVDMTHGNKRHMVGSPFWMPPEMIQGKEHGKPVDIWSLGVSLLEVVLKKPPNRSSSTRAMYIIASQGLGHSIKSSGCSSGLASFLHDCLKVNPAERSTADELLKHPFLEKAPERGVMSSIISSVFVAQMLTNGGFA
eukprot:TRINITY_DN1425_c0_g1_i4.p1 TRINITY_DN1425_c0_g1~~TRINITY_DN1425_c0_g1_i4.p1  ORF type:complete len:465 (-),score=137.09 TRINITY_DN1425_c0_g1_i4:123-1517(-)